MAIKDLSTNEIHLRSTLVKANEPGQLQDFQKLLSTSELPSLGSEPRSSREDLKGLELKLNAVFKNANLSSASQSLVRSLVLLWHDHLDESHSISQEIHNADGSFLHGIMH